LFEALERGEIDMEGIAEEVDTFTFAGHDTTTVAVNWALQAQWSILLWKLFPISSKLDLTKNTLFDEISLIFFGIFLQKSLVKI